LGRPKKIVFTNSVITAKILIHSTKIDAGRPGNGTKIKKYITLQVMKVPDFSASNA
jgi:hypothetical protein